MDRSIQAKVKAFVQEHIIERKAMFMPIAAVATFMLVGYAATDKEKPEIVSDQVNLSYGEELKSDMLDITDNNDDQEDLNIKLNTSSLDNEQLGEYSVEVNATDSFENTATKVVTVKVVDDKAPVFKDLSGNNGYVIEVPVKGNNDIANYITAIDNVDGNVTDFIEQSKKLDTSKEGTQSIKLAVEDSAGNKTVKTFDFVVGDYKSPDIKLLKGDKVDVNYNEPFNIYKYVKATDNVDGNLKVEVNGSVDTKKEGETKELVVTATDKAKNKTSVKLNVTVKDITGPAIKLNTGDKVVDTGTDINPKSFIASAIDNSDGDMKDKVSFNKIDTKTPGVRTITYSATDSKGNTTKVNLKITVQLSGQSFINTGMTKLGTPYVWGATGPNSFDCSGFTQWVYAQNGISIPRTSIEQRNSAKQVLPLSQAQPGDILWRNGHVGIYIGNGQYMHAPHTGDVVKISSLSSSSFTNALRYK